MPTNKKDVSASMIPLIALIDIADQHGINVKNLLIQTLKAIPEDVLTLDDKKARKKQLTKMLGSITSPTGDSPFDVANLLEEVLNRSH